MHSTSMRIERLRADLIRARWLRLACAFVAGYPLADLLGSPGTSVPLKIEVAAVLAVTTLVPCWGLVLIAALVPLGDMLAPLSGHPLVADGEPLVLAFLTAWFAVTAAEIDGPAGPVRLNLPLVVLTSIVIASVASTAYQLDRASPDAFHETVAGLTHSFFFSADTIGARAAANLLEGLALFGAAAALGRRYPWLGKAVAWTLVATALVGTVGSAFLARGIAPAATIARQQRHALPRYAATTGDVNAVASWYVLALGAAAGFILAGPRRRVSAAAACAVLVVGIWLTGSRAAFVAVAALVAVLAVLRAPAITYTRRHAAIAIALALALSGIGFSVARGIGTSADMRAGFTVASLRLAATRPVLGIGIGRYYALSEMVLPPSLGWFYGRENAHNFFLQLTAELGIVGIAAFVWLIADAVAGPIRHARSSMRGPLVAGMLAGLAGYLLTAMAGQPFLVLETSVPFWIVLGVVAGNDRASRPSPRHAGRYIALFGVLMALTVIVRPGVPRLRLRPGSDGFEALSGEPESRRFKQYASVYLSRDATGVELELRAVPPAETAGIGIGVPGWSERHVVVERKWSHVLITLPGSAPLSPEQRINLAVDPPPGSQPGSVAAELGRIRLVWTR